MKADYKVYERVSCKRVTVVSHEEILDMVFDQFQVASLWDPRGLVDPLRAVVLSRWVDPLLAVRQLISEWW